MDIVDRRELAAEVEEQLIIYLEGAVPEARALVVSDYENGVVSQAVLDTVLPLAKRHDLIITVDAHGGLDRFTGVTLVTPNQPEAEAALGRELLSLPEVRDGALELRRRLDAQAALITLGEGGMLLAAAAESPLWIPVAQHTRVADPTGAGDTVAAAMTAGMLGGATPLEAALLADLGARAVVRRLGAAVASADDILEEARGDAR